MLKLRLLRKTWVSGLGVSLAFQAVGWYLSWGILMLDAKIAAQQMCSPPTSARQHIKIAATDLAKMWVGEREIRLEGTLYDVCRQVSLGDSVHIEIYHDVREEALVATLFAWLATEEEAAKSHHRWLCQLLEAAYLLPVLPSLPYWRLQYFLPKFSYRLISAQNAPALNGPPPKS